MKVIKLNKKAIKPILKIALSVALVLYVIFAPIFVLVPLRQKQNIVSKEIEISYMGILELWNIDTFEGGSVSRSVYLEKLASKFEKQNTGCFVMCSNMSVEQAKLNLQNGLVPDIISFGSQIGSIFLDKLVPIEKKYQVRNDLLIAGKCNNVQYAVPYLFGGYVVISENQYQENMTLGFGGESLNNGLNAFCVNDLKANNIYEKSLECDTFSAYDKYLSKKFDALVGTQRDLYRVTNRISNGNMTQRNFKYLKNYTDLVQFMGVCTKDILKEEICFKFLDYALSDEAQTKLENINMFSVTKNNLYSSGEFKEMEKALSSNLKTINAFTPMEKLNEIKKLSLETLSENSQKINELKKYFC